MERTGGPLGGVRASLDERDSPVTLFFRDDDAGWRSDRLRALLDLFAEFALPVDLAVIPAALDRALADELAERPIGLHQHGFAHLNHEPDGRKFEFGPSRDAREQREDIEAGARRLQRLLGDRVDPIFTPPWNRCTTDTGRCLLDLGFRALSREHQAEPLEVPGLEEVPIHVDWCKPDREDRLAKALHQDGPVGVMLHHAEMDAAERARAAELLSLLAEHARVRARPMATLI
jgi:peptidoglycan/xylan/chitin deacetylase (PgdA/CDA1 family)